MLLLAAYRPPTFEDSGDGGEKQADVRNEALRLLFKTLSRAPLRALYTLSGVLYLLAYYVARHRHQVIREQLAKVFPSISEAQRTAIHQRFLRNFCDVLVEAVKSLSLAPAEMSARVRI